MRGYFSLIERSRYRFLLTIVLATILLQPLRHGLMFGWKNLLAADTLMSEFGPIR